MGIGRPPTKYSDKEIVLLGKEMLKWIRAHKKDPDFVHLSCWYSEVKDICRSHWHEILKREPFRHYYETAMDFLAVKTMTNKDLNTAYGSRFVGVYCKQLRDHEKEIAAAKKEKDGQDQAPLADGLDMKAKYYASEYKLQLLQKELDDLKSKTDTVI